MLDVIQMKHNVNRMPLEKVRKTVEELNLEGFVCQRQTPFSRAHFNICFAEIEALLQRAGYHKQVDVLGYDGLTYAMFDPSRWDAVEVLRTLKQITEQAVPSSGSH
ncbi:transcriptional regulator [Pseudomonas sp. 5P_3.1_Bac2]|uniref:transcriptional regulator n=1 Tax=Pseudomonas sp. 5P_3.1_Bac2 TaxID=2971617 RepID=UPI0021C9AC30|nr:transcriptional regulator [Pseudomonas sp. 5P_3.1_Bac2]MCU1716317.1 transcriptional regulator [Pseudomonas sp. 5P_3.1_Bac2]